MGILSTPQAIIHPRNKGWILTTIVQSDLSKPYSWWFQPIYKILGKLDNFPQVGVKTKHIWKLSPSPFLKW